MFFGHSHQALCQRHLHFLGMSSHCLLPLLTPSFLLGREHFIPSYNMSLIFPTQSDFSQTWMWTLCHLLCMILVYTVVFLFLSRNCGPCVMGLIPLALFKTTLAISEGNEVLLLHLNCICLIRKKYGHVHLPPYITNQSTCQRIAVNK